MYEGKGTPIHPSGLNIIQNPDGSYQFEWDSKDERWSWLNGLTLLTVEPLYSSG